MFLLGHSHVVPLEHAATAMGVPYQSLNLWEFGRPVLYDEGPVRLAEELAGRLDEFVVSAIGGSAHDVLGLAQHPRPFDVVLPEQPDLPLISGAELLPTDAVREAIRQAISDTQRDLLRLLIAPGRRVVHVESPPPSPPSARLRDEMGNLAFTGQSALGPSPVWLRYKLWCLNSAVVRQQCEDAGVEFLPYPPEAMIDGCCLRPDLYLRPCHANVGYGELVLRQLGFGA